jgi:single-stranded DNA-binding protein
MTTHKQNDSQYRSYSTRHNLSLIKVCTEPEARFLDNGTQVASFKTVMIDAYQMEGQPQMVNETWVKISAFGKQAEAIAKLQKGEFVLLELKGHPMADTWTKEDGTIGTSLVQRFNGFPTRVTLVKSDAAATIDPQSEPMATDTSSPVSSESPDLPF